MRYLPADISYGIECSVELCDTTADVAQYFYSFNDRSISAEHDALENGYVSWEDSHRRYSHLYKSVYEDWFYNRATTPQRVWCLMAASDGFARRHGELIDSLYRRYVSKCLIEQQDPSREDVMTTYFEQEPGWNHIVENTTALTNRINFVGGNIIQTGFINSNQVYLEAQVEELGRCIAEERGAALDAVIDFLDNKMPPKSSRRVHLVQKKAKKVLKKSSLLLSRLMGRDDTIAFIRGDEIRVEGMQYVFVLKKKNIYTTGHGAFRISVHDRTDDQRLVDLCWYIPETPALDQLAALVMAVKSGDEKEIIEVGNHLSITQAAHDHPEFAKLLPQCGIIVNGNMISYGPIMNADEDRMMNYTMGTTEYAATNTVVFQSFVNIANQSLNVLNTLDPCIQSHFALHTANQIRPIVNGRLGNLASKEPDMDGETFVAQTQTMLTQLQNVVDTRANRLIAA